MNKFDKKRIRIFFFKMKKKILKLSETYAQIYFLKSDEKKFQVHLFRMYRDGQIDHISKTENWFFYSFQNMMRPFPTYGHAAPPPPPLLFRSGGNFMKDAECADCIYVYTLEFSSVSPTKKNVLRVTKFIGKMSNGLKRMKNQFYYLLQFLVFEILLNLYWNSEKNTL